MVPAQERPYQLCGTRSVLLNGYWVRFPPIKRPGLEADHASPYIGEVKNELSRFSSPPKGLHGTDTNDFTLFPET